MPAEGYASDSDPQLRVDSSTGFAVMPALGVDDLAIARELISAQWETRLAKACPSRVEDFVRRGMDHYHELSEEIDHARLWPKAERVLPAESVSRLMRMDLFRRLEAEFGPYTISNEEGLEAQEIYWRLVRPAAESDVGPVHADRWFWDLDHGHTPKGVRRVKVWVAIFCEPGLSGLRVLPGSHRREWRYHGEKRNGITKPCIDEDVDSLGLELLRTDPGQAVIFHDGLLHGGALNRGATTRVSFEFTMFVSA